MDYSYSDYHNHPQVQVDNRSVDEGMADLMRIVWDYGLRTVNCCQGGPEKMFTWAWIQFGDIADGIKFLEATGFLTGWKFADDIHMYLTPPILPQTPATSVVLINYVLLPEITKLWEEGTAKPPAPETKE